MSRLAYQSLVKICCVSQVILSSLIHRKLINVFIENMFGAKNTEFFSFTSALDFLLSGISITHDHMNCNLIVSRDQSFRYHSRQSRR